MLGIPSYKPKLYSDFKSFRNDFKETFKNLIGKRIERFWIMWQLIEDKWLKDGPVILEIEEKRLEFTAYKLDEFSLTINSFELDEKLDWYGSGDEMPLVWKENGKVEMIKNLNKPIKEINILTYNFISEYVENGNEHETGDMLTGIEFVLEKENKWDKENYFSIFNGLDQNEIAKIEIQQNEQIRRIRV